MARLFESLEYLDRLSREAESRARQFEAARSSFTPDQAQNVALMAQQYGSYAQPGVVAAMGMARLDPYSSDVRQVAEQSATYRAKRGDFVEPGDKGGVWESVLAGSKTFLRGMFVGLSAPFEELSALASSVGEAALDDDPGMGDVWENYTDRARPSTLRLAYAAWQRGDISLADWRGTEEFLGTGILPGGEMYAEQEQMKHRLELDGQFVTPGRVLATPLARSGMEWFEPGEVGYNLVSGTVDFAANIVADPAAWATAGAGKAVAATRRLDDAADVARYLRPVRDQLNGSLARGPRKTVHAPGARSALVGNRDAVQLVRELTNEQNAGRIWRLSGGKFDTETTRRIADAADDTETVGVLDDVLGTSVGEKPSLPSFTQRAMSRTYGTARLPGVKRNLNGVRLAYEMPGPHLDAEDAEAGVKGLHDWMRNAKFNEGQIDDVLDEFIRIDRTSPNHVADQWRVVKRAHDMVADELTLRGRPRSFARGVTQMVDDWATEFRSYAEDEFGRPLDFPFAKKGLTVDGVEETLPTAMLLVQYAKRGVPLADARQLRQNISALAPVFDIPGVRVTTGLLTNVLNTPWKAMVLLRGALTTRVIGEEQLRMGGADLSSAFAHPIDYIAWLTGRKGGGTIQGDGWREIRSFGDAMSRGRQWGGGEAGGIRTGDFRRFQQGQAGFLEAWGARLSQFANDEVASVVARIGPEQAKAWFKSPAADEFRDQLFRNFGWQQSEGVADEYVDSVSRFLHGMTGGSAKTGAGGNPALLQAIADGKIGDVEVFETRYKLNKLADELERNFAESAPQAVHGARDLTVKGRRGEMMGLFDRLDRFTNFMFDGLLSKPTNAASRGPAYKQLYYREVERLLPWMDADLQAEVIGEAAGLGVKMARPKEALGKLTDLAHVDLVAQDVANRATKRLLFDLSKRQQAGDAMRAIMPFYEPWREMVTSWARIGRDNPSIVRRGQQLVTGARGADPFNTGHGIFYTDDFGQEVFSYPAGGLIGRFLGLEDENTDFRITGRAGGLNLIAGQFVPGFGPAITVPASHLIPNKPSWDGVREFVLPYGDASLADNFTPSWLDALQDSWADPESDRMFASTVIDVMRILEAQGGYADERGMVNRENAARLLNDATRKARYLSIIRGLGPLLGSPTTVQGDFRVKVDEPTPQGSLTVAALAGEYHKMSQDVEAGGYDTALERFAARFGTDALIVTQGKSRRVNQRALSKTGYMWERAHPEQVDEFRTVVGLFAPNDPEADMDMDAYINATETGDRERLTPSEALALHNNSLGWEAYNHFKAELGDDIYSLEGRIAAATEKERLKTEYPGFDSSAGIAKAPSVETLVNDLYRAAQDEVLGSTPAGQGLNLYLNAREQAKQIAQQQFESLDFRRSQATEPLRHELRSIATDIIAQHPEFAGMWDQVFKRELSDDDAVLGEQEAMTPREKFEAAMRQMGL